MDVDQLLLNFHPQPHEQRQVGLGQIMVQSLGGANIGFLQHVRFRNATSQASIQAEGDDPGQAVADLLEIRGQRPLAISLQGLEDFCLRRQRGNHGRFGLVQPGCGPR
jgi:hypothetical protein